MVGFDRKPMVHTYLPTRIHSYTHSPTQPGDTGGFQDRVFARVCKNSAQKFANYTRVIIREGWILLSGEIVINLYIVNVFILIIKV